MLSQMAGFSSLLIFLNIIFKLFSIPLYVYTVFHNGCTNLHAYKEGTKIPFSPHPRQ